MSERYMTGVEMQAELLAEARRTRVLIGAIRSLLVLEFVLGVLGVLVAIFLAVKMSR